uniref:Reverse transcriptase Ty1/copia-type domain-containing protein n=1 Tax=Fagus sylvatica TaxID=28930 RepID=A0A2N9IVZ2_FAGSY
MANPRSNDLECSNLFPLRNNYFHKFTTLADTLAAIEHPLSDYQLVSFFMSGLGSEYDPMVASIQTHSRPYNLDDLYGLFLSHELWIAQNQPTVDLSHASANYATNSSSHRSNNNGGRGGGRNNYGSGRGSFSNSQRNPRGRGRGRNTSNRPVCQVCHKPGHAALTCYHRFDNSYTAEASQNMHALYASPHAASDLNWYSDSGATHHLTNDLANLNVRAEEYTGSESIRVGSGLEGSFWYKGRVKMGCIPFPASSNKNSPRFALLGERASLQHWHSRLESSLEASMNLEFDALMKNGTWVLTSPSPSQNLIGCKWVYRIKRHADGSIERYKARLVAKGFHQQPGIDYGETFSPVIKPTTVRTVLSIALSAGWSIRQIDIQNAFLHGNLSEEVFMHQPPGYSHPSFPNHVCKLKKALYGLKQAPRAWFSRLSTRLVELGFHGSLSDTSLFIYKSSIYTMFILTYVDDIIITSSSSSAIDNLLSSLQTDFAVKDLGSLHYFLGIEVIRNTAWNSPVSKTTLFRSTIGALQYLSLTRPDIAFTVNKLSQFMHKPTLLHWQSVKHLLRYLKHTLTYGLQIFKSSCLDLQAFSDADWAGNKDDRRSTGNFCVFLGKNLISWSCRNPYYMNLAYPSGLLLYFGVTTLVQPIYPPIQVFHARTKHVEIDFHFVRDMVAAHQLLVRFFSSQDQLADLLTKPISSSRFALLQDQAQHSPLYR